MFAPFSETWGGTEYPFLCICSDKVSDKALGKLNKKGIETIKVEPIKLPEWVRRINNESNYSHWNNTFEKLYVFGLAQYEKIILIDADMLVLKKIDNLFKLPHLSAVAAGKNYPGNEHWDTLNSGLIVIEPSSDLPTKMMETLDRLNISKPIGDQDLIHEYAADWPSRQELHLSEEYNCFYSYMEYYLNHNILSEIKVVHYAGKMKPWMFTAKDALIKCYKMAKRHQFINLWIFVRWRVALLLSRM